LSELEDDTRLDFDNLKSLLDQQQAYFDSIVQQENELHGQIQTRKISILDKMTREIVLKSYLGMDFEIRQHLTVESSEEGSSATARVVAHLETPEKVLDNELAAIQRSLANALEVFEDEKLSLFTGELEKALNGLEVAHQVMKANAKKSLQNRLNKRRAQRKNDLLSLRLSPDRIDTELQSEVLPESEMIAQVEQKFDESYEKEYPDQKNRIVSLEGNHATDDKNLKQKEDLEASNLRNKILSDENSNLQQNLDSSLLTVQMTKDMTKKTFEETEQRINSIREQYEEEIIRIQAELLAAKKKELEALEAKSAESATTAAGGVAVETPEVATA
jgi:hypothetical protein